MNIIVAVCKNNGIGKNNALPWALKKELKYFKEKTIGNGNNVVVMGNNTFKSLKKPLPNRKNIIFTRKNDNELVKLNMKNKVSKNDFKNPIFFNNVKNFNNYIKVKKYSDIWVIGGSEIYRKFLPYTHKIYLTQIYKDFDCDTFFPHTLYNFKLKECSSVQCENNIEFRYKIFVNNNYHKIEEHPDMIYQDPNDKNTWGL